VWRNGLVLFYEGWSINSTESFYSLEWLRIAWGDVQVAKGPSGLEINALEQHIANLLTPSTPFFFNTLYDPYWAGADFVRGCPTYFHQVFYILASLVN
jgi:hypothetical protein